MELKRSLTKRLRSRRTAPPEKLDLPPRASASIPNGTGLYTAPATPISGLHTPQPSWTPSTEEFAAIPFDGTSCASKFPESVSPTRSVTSSVHSSRSSRSGSVASAHFAPANWSLHALAPLQTQTDVAGGGVLLSPGSARLSLDPTFEGGSDDGAAPADGKLDEDVYEADQMAQRILEKVHEGGKHNWSL